MAYGKYLINVASCIECHSPVKKGQIINELAFSGGRSFIVSSGTVISSNITPDPETGIGNWSRSAFIQRFKAFADSGMVLPNIGKSDFQTLMPWKLYAGMTDEDLSSIYQSLMQNKAIKTKVEKFIPGSK